MIRPPADPPPPSHSRDASAAATVGDLSEAELLERVLPLLVRPADRHVLLGPGDDCAVVAAPDGRFVVTTDTQVQDQDFRLSWPSGVVTTGFDTGVKCAAQNLADVAAMGAVPTAVVVSLTLPPETPVSWPEDFARGLTAGFAAMGADRCSVVGGDLGAGRELSVTATVTGDLEGREPVRRSGAGAGGVLALAEQPEALLGQPLHAGERGQAGAQHVLPGVRPEPVAVAPLEHGHPLHEAALREQPGHVAHRGLAGTQSLRHRVQRVVTGLRQCQPRHHSAGDGRHAELVEEPAQGLLHLEQGAPSRGGAPIMGTVRAHHPAPSGLYSVSTEYHSALTE